MNIRTSFILLTSLFVVLLFSLAFTSRSVEVSEFGCRDGVVLTYVQTFDNGRADTTTVEFKSHQFDKRNKVTRFDAVLTGKWGGTLTYYHKYRYYLCDRYWAVDAENFTPMGCDVSRYTEDSDSLVYPFSMKIGDTLSNAYGIKYSTGDEYSADSMRLFYSKRVVVGIDTLKLKDRMLPVFVVQYELHSWHRYRDSGKLKTFEETRTCYCWFNSEFGVVKAYEPSKYGNYKSELNSIYKPAHPNPNVKD